MKAVLGKYIPESIIWTAAVLVLSSSVLIHADSNSVKVSAGTFLRGSADGEEDERPVSRVRVSSFSMMSKEVTYAQYRRCVKAGRCTPAHYDDGKCLRWTGKTFKKAKVPRKYRKADMPVVCVTWHQAKAYCSFVGMKLPTETQWEYAAKGGKQSRYSWGNASPSGSRCGLKAPHSVGSFAPNGFGLFDMTGNVWEWTADYYDKNSYAESGKEDSEGSEAGFYRVLRGGGWYSGSAGLRVSNRHWFSPNFAEASVGFRCAR
ncbi:MAG: formylglycine-generating enzyme family protein [Chitinispirillaceae bacterium]